MTRKCTQLLCTLVVVFLFFPHQVYPDSQYKYAPNPDQKIYFGHISFTEVENDDNDPVVFSVRDQTPERAILNFPIAPGDIIRTSSIRRCEIQFDTGTIIRLDHNTQIRVETILAPSLSSNKKISNLLLERGQIYVMYKRYSSPEIFQVITPNATVKLNHKSVSFIKMNDTGATDIWVDEGKVNIKYGEKAQQVDSKTIKKSRQVSINPDHQVVTLETDREPGFLAWNENLNENFLALHMDRSKLPKPIQKYPKAVHYFAQKYSYRYGEWLWHDLYGFVWRPLVEGFPLPGAGRLPNYGWRPMAHGQWHTKGNDMYWIPAEPWGWVPYHLGVWAWDKNKGWLWLPGSFFDSAWVSWIAYVGISSPLGYYPSYLAWRPWYIWDWDYRFAAYQNMFPSNVRKDLAKTPPLYKLPKAYKPILARIERAFRFRSPGLISALQDLPDGINVVMASDLNSPRIQEKFVSSEQVFSKADKGVLKTGEQAKIAVFRSLRFNQRSLGQAINDSVLPMKSGNSRHMLKSMIPTSLDTYSYSNEGIKKSSQINKGIFRQEHSSLRIRDFNPDIKIAQRYGVSIHYSSHTNKVMCPELGLTTGFSRRNAFWNRSGANRFASQAAAFANAPDSQVSSSGPKSPSKVGATATAGAGTGKTRTKKN